MAAVPVMAQSGLTVDGRLLGRPFQRDVNHGHLVDVGHLEHALGDH